MWTVPRHLSLLPFQLQLFCQGTLCTESPGTIPSHAHFSFTCPARETSCMEHPRILQACTLLSPIHFPQGTLCAENLGTHQFITTSTLAVLLNYPLGRTSGSPACTQFGFSYPARAPSAWRTQGLPVSHTASAPATLPGHPQHRAREFPQLAPTSASSVLLGGPLCRNAQDPLAYTQSSFCCSSRMLATWRAPEPPGSHSISASASLPENPLHREPQNIPYYTHFRFS